MVNERVTLITFHTQRKYEEEGETLFHKFSQRAAHTLRPPLACVAMAFSPHERWSPRTQGYVGTTWRNDGKDDAPGSSPEKTTLLMGNGYSFDRAELARIEASERGRDDKSPSGAKVTVQGEERALAAKTPPRAFDGRTPRRTPPRKPVPKAKSKLERTSHGHGATHTHQDGTKPSTDGQRWDDKTRGYINTHHGWPRSSTPFLSKGIINREPERLNDGGAKHDKTVASDKQYWDDNTRGFTNTGHGWPRSSKPFLSKGIIDREPERLSGGPGGTHHDAQSRPSGHQYWDDKTRGYTNTGHGWPRSSTPFLSKDIIYRV